MTITPELIGLAILALLVVFAAGAGSGTFLGNLWTKAKAWDAAEAAKAKAEFSKIEAAVSTDAKVVKATAEVGWDEFAGLISGWKTELAAAVAARVKADAAATAAAAALAASKNTPIAANLAATTTTSAASADSATSA
jgi:hypothetical protein